MNSTYDGNIGHIVTAIEKHQAFVVTSLAIDRCVENGSEWFFEKSIGGRMIGKLFPSGHTIKRTIENPVYKYFGWKGLHARAMLTKRFAEELAKKMLDYETAEVMKPKLQGLAERARDAAFEETMRQHPSKIVVERNLFALAPAEFLAVAAPALAIKPPPIAAVSQSDPFVRTVARQNYYFDSSHFTVSRNDSSPSSPSRSPETPSSPQGPSPFQATLSGLDAEFEARNHQAAPLMPDNSSSWNGNKNSTLYNK